MSASPEPRPIGRTCLVRVLPPEGKSSIIQVVEQDDRLTHKAVVEVKGPKCRFVEEGQTYIVRTSLGVPMGDRLMVPEVACMALCLA